MNFVKSSPITSLVGRNPFNWWPYASFELTHNGLRVDAAGSSNTEVEALAYRTDSISDM
jgi:hypothetical protein